jgi:uncharacterized protein
VTRIVYGARRSQRLINDTAELTEERSEVLLNGVVISGVSINKPVEHLTGEWLMLDADVATSGGPVSRCGPSRIGTGSRAFKLDLLATVADKRGVGKVSVVGEVKSGQERTGLDQLERLDAAVSKLDPAKVAAPPKRLLVARSGFTRELEQRARTRADVELVDLPRLYGGT